VLADDPQTGLDSAKHIAKRHRARHAQGRKCARTIVKVTSSDLTGDDFQ